MKVALNMGSLRGLGSRCVGQSLLEGLGQIGSSYRYWAWVPSDWPSRLPVGPTYCRVRTGVSWKFINENWTIRRRLTEGGFDRLFSLGDTSLPHSGIPHLLMVQQAFLAYPPDNFDFAMTTRMSLRMRLMALYFRAGLSSVTCFTVQTQTMKRHLAERWSIDPGRISVVPSPVQPRILRAEPPASPPYICYPAPPGLHKNHLVLAPMMAALKESNVDLQCVLTVEPSELPQLVRRAEELGVLERFSFLGRIDRSRVEQLLRQAVAAIIPSKLESFGLTYYEAMAAGCPVVAADRDFAREACGEAGMYAEADDGVAFADQVMSLLSSEQERRRYSDAGQEQFAGVKRSKEEVALEYLKILDSMKG